MSILRATLAKASVAALIFVGNPAAWAADPVAFVADVRGDVALEGNGRAAFLAELPPGSRLVLGPGATAAVMYVVSGEEFALKGPGEFSIAKDGVKATQGAAPARRVSPVRPSAAVLVQTSRAATASLRMRSAPPGKSEPAGLQYPVNGKVAALQPTLRWGGDASSSFLVVVSGADGKEVYRGNAKGLTLRLPVKLAAGKSYVWSCSDARGPIGESRFETHVSSVIQAAEKARGSAKGFSDRVAFALLLQDLDATQDAREIWIQLANERPDLPEIAGLAR